MKTIRAIFIAAGIWVLGVTAFSLSYYIPVLNDLDLQSNLVLAIVLIPLAIVGTKLYYKKPANVKPFMVAVIMFLTLGCLDALFTVPFLMKPIDLGYSDFFLDYSFWLIALEFLVTATISGHLEQKRHVYIH